MTSIKPVNQRKTKSWNIKPCGRNNKRRRIGYAYKTKNGGICIKGDKLLDKTQFGKLLSQGVYVFLDGK